MDLFDVPAAQKPSSDKAPLAARMRPRTLEEFAGQKHLLAEGKLLQRSIRADRVSSVVFFGPPGTGKTSLAEVIANATKKDFAPVNAVASSVAELRAIIEKARHNARHAGRETILFIDEIHRFNKAQQDVLLPHVENGDIRLIGATTHNPFFSINAPLLSRSQIFELKPLSTGEVAALLRRALTDRQRGLGALNVIADEEALAHLAKISDGDARKALNALELGVKTTPPDSGGAIRFTVAVAEESIQKKQVVYDADEDGHYDTISAFIKSIRGSDPDAALYWMAKMLYAGEDPRFIARRLVIAASEDVGNADPQALVIATAALQALEFVGLPEGRIPLAQAVIYAATAPKSNSAIVSIDAAASDVASGRTLAVPTPLRDAHYKGAKRLGRGEGYQYSHDHEGHYVAQEYLEEARKYYFPSDQGFEKIIAQRLKEWEAKKKAASGIKSGPVSPA